MTRPSWPSCNQSVRRRYQHSEPLMFPIKQIMINFWQIGWDWMLRFLPKIVTRIVDSHKIGSEVAYAWIYMKSENAQTSLQIQGRQLFMPSTLGKNFSKRHFEIFFTFFPWAGFDISCKLSPMETICMKFQILFSGKKRKNITNVSSAELARTVAKV